MQLKTRIEDTTTITSRGGEINILISPTTVGSNHLVMGYSQVGVNERVTPHVHDYSEEAFFVLEGQGRIYFDQNDFIDFTSGEAVLVPQGKPHWIQNTGSHVMKVIFAVSPLAPTPGAGHREITL
jgi:putative monooxygenase